MTIALCVRVGDGVVLASDSATSLKVAGGAGPAGIGQIYHGARKLIRPCSSVPVGFVTYGQGTIEDQSIASLAVGLRQRLEGGGDWEIDPQAYTVIEVAERIRDFYSDRVATAVNKGQAPHTEIGFLVSGYAAQAEQPEVREIRIATNGDAALDSVDPNEGASLSYRGFTDPLDRLIKGVSKAANLVVGAQGAVGQLALQHSKLTLVSAEMPLSEAVDLAKWLAEVARGAMHFGPGAEIIGGEIDIARIDRDEGFVWVQQQALPVQQDAVDAL